MSRVIKPIIWVTKRYNATDGFIQTEERKIRVISIMWNPNSRPECQTFYYKILLNPGDTYIKGDYESSKTKILAQEALEKFLLSLFK
jgi:hypothetical protein